MVFSIVIPAFNEEKYIKKCLQSCLNLNYPKIKYEIIVVDNNSTDKTIKIVNEFKQVKLVKEKAQGISFARQKGLKKCKGKYYVSIDADTILPSDWLIKVEKIINKNKNFACIYGPVKIHDSSNAFFTKSVYLATLFLGLIDKHIYNCNAIYNKNKLLKIGGFNHKYPNYDDSILSSVLKRNNLIILFNHDLIAYISGRRYLGLKAFSIFKNLCVYYKYKLFHI